METTVAKRIAAILCLVFVWPVFVLAGDVYWVGTADAVAQVDTATPANVEVDDIFYLKVDGTTMATFTATAATVANVTDGLTTAWNAATHPYATAITATDSTTHVTLTADTPGCPFTVTADEANGGGTDDQTLTMATPTANSGPNDWDTAANWSGGAVPVLDDVVWIADNDVNICWNLDTTDGGNPAEIHITQTYTGRIGLNRRAFATSANGVTTDSTKPEYRGVYLKVDCSAIYIGEHFGPGTPDGSDRIMLDNTDDDGTPIITVFNTASSAAEDDLPAVRLLVDDSSQTLFVRSAPGGIGVAVDAPGETSTLNTISVADDSSTEVFVGPGVTLATWTQDGGSNYIYLGDELDLSTLTINGGTLRVDGIAKITSYTINDGTCYLNNDHEGGIAVDNSYLKGGTTILTETTTLRTLTNVTLYSGAELRGDSNVVTITTLNEPTGPYTIIAED